MPRKHKPVALRHQLQFFLHQLNVLAAFQRSQVHSFLLAVLEFKPQRGRQYLYRFYIVESDNLLRPEVAFFLHNVGRGNFQVTLRAENGGVLRQNIKQVQKRQDQENNVQVAAVVGVRFGKKQGAAVSKPEKNDG